MNIAIGIAQHNYPVKPKSVIRFGLKSKHAYRECLDLVFQARNTHEKVS